MAYAAELAGLAGKATPPVERWNPPYCGELDLVIRADGVWVHEGTPIGRAKLVRLFASVLKKEDDRFYLVTPAEKLGIRVEDAPFLAVLMRAEGEGERRRLIFTTNVGEELVAGADHPISFRARAGRGSAPYILVRRGLEALIARAVFYDLAALGETRQTPDGDAFGVRSDGVFFPFAPAGDVYGDE